jgi:hypothetical protein
MNEPRFHHGGNPAPNDPRLDLLADALRGIIASSTMALRTLGELRAPAPPPHPHPPAARGGLPAMFGRTAAPDAPTPDDEADALRRVHAASSAAPSTTAGEPQE